MSFGFERERERETRVLNCREEFGNLSLSLRLELVDLRSTAAKAEQARKNREFKSGITTVIRCRVAFLIITGFSPSLVIIERTGLFTTTNFLYLICSKPNPQIL